MLDEPQLERLYVRLERPVFNVVFRRVWNRDTAFDVTQETFARLWSMRERVRMETVEPLVFRIAVNLASNRRRSARLWRWVGLESVEDGDAMTETDLRHDAQRLKDAIEALSPKPTKAVLATQLGVRGFKRRDGYTPVGLCCGDNQLLSREKLSSRWIV